MQLSTNKNLLASYGAWAVVTGASSGIGREMARQHLELKIDDARKTALAQVTDQPGLPRVLLRAWRGTEQLIQTSESSRP